MPFVQLNTDDMMVPVLVPQTASPAVTGWNSNLVIGGLIGVGLLVSWLMSGYVTKKKAAGSGGRRKAKKVPIRKGRK